MFWKVFSINFRKMVRHYKRTSTRGKYGAEVLQTALRLINEGRSVKSISREFSIPPRTLRRHRDRKTKNPGMIVLGPKQPVLPPAFEDELKNYIFLMEKRMYSITATDVRRLAFLLAERAGLKHNFSQSTGMAGKDWLTKFLERHSQISVRVPIGTSLNRLEGFNKASVKIFFDNYKAILDEIKFDRTMLYRLWNSDETGLSTVVDPGKVLCTKGAKQVRKATSGERGKNVTALCNECCWWIWSSAIFRFPPETHERCTDGQFPSWICCACERTWDWIYGLKAVCYLASPFCKACQLL